MSGTHTEQQHRDIAAAAGLVPDPKRPGWYSTTDGRWRLHLGIVLGFGEAPDVWEWMIYDTTGRASRGYPVRCPTVTTALRYAVESIARERATTVRTDAA